MSELGNRMREIQLPAAAAGEQRRAHEAAALVGARRRPGRRFGVSAMRPALLVALLAVALVGFAFTPPGRAVTRELGELVGIGEPATLPPNDSGPFLTHRGDAVVIASGQAPDESAYEVVANLSIAKPMTGIPVIPGSGAESPQQGHPVTCLSVDLPRAPKLDTGENCVGTRDRDYLSGDVIGAVSISDRAEPGKESEFAGSSARYVVGSLVSPNIVDARVSYEDGSMGRVDAYTDVGQVTDEIAATIGSENHAGYLVSFLPDDGLPSMLSGRGPDARYSAGILGSVQVEGFDASGELVAAKDAGKDMERSYDRQRIQREERQRLVARIAMAQLRNGLALTRANVDLCRAAIRYSADPPRCPKLLQQAAAQDLYGLHSAGPDGEDVVLP